MSKSFEEIERKLKSVIALWGVHPTLQLYSLIEAILDDVKGLCDENALMKRKLRIVGKNNAPLIQWIEHKLKEERNEKKGKKAL